MIQKQRSLLSKLLLVTALSAATFGGIYYYRTNYSNVVAQPLISDYKPARDRADIIAVFNSEDLYWLSASDYYNAAFMLDNHAPNDRDMRYFGALQIKVLREGNEFIGFTAYYKKTANEGMILFVYVKPEMRGKRYAQKLVEYDLEALRAMGVHIVKLLTRTSNHRAQAVYNRLGFTVTSIDEEGGFVYYMKIV